MSHPYKMIIPMQKMLLGEVEHDVKVTAMGSKKFHCRIYTQIREKNTRSLVVYMNREILRCINRNMQ